MDWIRQDEEGGLQDVEGDTWMNGDMGQTNPTIGRLRTKQESSRRSILVVY